MKIRHLEKADFDQCIDLLQAFAHEIGDDTLIETHRDFSQIKRILVLCLCSGTSWVAEDEGLIAGILLSFREPDLWRRNYLRIRELAWFVRPDYRQGSAAGRLFRAYQKSCDELYQQGVIQSYTISKLSLTPDIDFESRGFMPIETTYQRGA